MKLSFSINGWDGYSWEDFVQTALEVGMQGIELRGSTAPPSTPGGGPFHPHQTAATARSLFEKNLQIPCLDAVCEPLRPGRL